MPFLPSHKTRMTKAPQIKKRLYNIKNKNLKPKQ